MENKKQTDEVLKNFMREFFPYAEFKKIGLFTKEMRNDYEAQAKRICDLFGYETVYEYGAEEIRCHISYADGARPTWINKEGKLETEPFVTVIKSIYE